MILLLVEPACALTCAEVTDLVARGVPDTAVAAAILEQGLPPEEAACVAKAGFSDPIGPAADRAGRSAGRGADDIPPGQARTDDPWTREWVGRLVVTARDASIAQLTGEERLRVETGVTARHYLADPGVLQSDWSPWLTAALSEDAALRARAVRGVFYGGRLAADGALMVPSDQSLKDWVERRVAIGTGTFAPSVLNADTWNPLERLRAVWVEVPYGRHRDSGVWAARLNGEIQVEGQALGDLLGVDASRCGKRLVEVGYEAGGGLFSGPTDAGTAVYASMPDRPDQCLDRAAVVVAATGLDQQLRRRFGLDGYALTSGPGALAEQVQRSPPADSSDVPDPQSFFEEEELNLP